MTKDEALKIKINFGKYNGKTIGEIYSEDSNYLVWIFRNINLHPDVEDALITLGFEQ